MISEGVGLVAGDVNATSWRKFNHHSFEVDRAPLPSTKLGPQTVVTTESKIDVVYPNGDNGAPGKDGHRCHTTS